MATTHLIMFGDSKFQKSIELLMSEAEKSGVFSSVKAYKETDLSPSILEFAKENRRGFGYWSWKPFVISKAMKEKPIGDIILYMDVGCTIHHSSEALDQFHLLTTKVMEDDNHRLAFYSKDHIEETWCKADLLQYLNCNSDKFRKSVQIEGGQLYFLNSDANQRFVQKWLEIAQMDNGHMIDDTPSRILNTKSFKEHRHDQAILSLLFKKYGGIVMPNGNVFAANTRRRLEKISASHVIKINLLSVTVVIAFTIFCLIYVFRNKLRYHLRRM